MRWPRGKYNGKRIVGVRITMVLDIMSWGLMHPFHRTVHLLWLGPLRFWFEANYGARDGE